MHVVGIIPAAVRLIILFRTATNDAVMLSRQWQLLLSKTLSILYTFSAWVNSVQELLNLLSPFSESSCCSSNNIRSNIIVSKAKDDGVRVGISLVSIGMLLDACSLVNESRTDLRVWNR